ncbi:hypothetical protein CAPTEDRAFT_181110 [Capitella teleta]|uniref:Homeobox domain-containing protein n=1 Tax=Capitella teleta TaxID=283909 RepID=R7UMJ1_CAPTE|nr:hypothetical protein CAPTEDRAFT_181110 [Capitella teleta]|eukprot:ELU04462.1 hypothetical protein CAPTEDRAFT_181110 [Capitella teleta]
MTRSTRTRGQNPKYQEARPAASAPSNRATPATSATKTKKARENHPPATIAIMMSWLVRNLFDPYPSDEEKSEMATAGKITVLQVINWFINARRRVLPGLLAPHGIPLEDVVRPKRNKTAVKRLGRPALSPSILFQQLAAVASSALMQVPPTVSTDDEYASSAGQCSPQSVDEDSDHDYCQSLSAPASNPLQLLCQVASVASVATVKNSTQLAIEDAPPMEFAQYYSY